MELQSKPLDTFFHWKPYNQPSEIEWKSLPAIFLKQNWCWKLMSLICSIHFSSRCDPWIYLRMSTISSNTWKTSFGMYAFLIHSIHDGRLPTFFLFNVMEKWLNIWSIWSWVCPTRRKPNSPFERFPFQQACLDIQTQFDFIFTTCVVQL